MRSFRNQLGLSQEGLAYEADINRSYIASLEAGQRNPSLDLMARLATALSVDLGDLVRGLHKKKGALMIAICQQRLPRNLTEARSGLCRCLQQRTGPPLVGVGRVS